MQESTGTIIQQYWPVVLFVLGIIVSWVRYENKIDDLKRTSASERLAYDKEINSVKIQVGVIESKIEAYKDKTGESIGAIREDIREIKTILKGNVITE